jgi:hypothetical protein
LNTIAVFNERNIGRFAAIKVIASQLMGGVMCLAALTRYATCDEISHNGRAISAMKKGSKARIRLGSRGGDFGIYLIGFTVAYDRAAALTRRK